MTLSMTWKPSGSSLRTSPRALQCRQRRSLWVHATATAPVDAAVNVPHDKAVAPARPSEPEATFIEPEAPSRPYVSSEEKAGRTVPEVSADGVVELEPTLAPASVGQGRFWAAYCDALETHPIPVKSATSFFGFLLGDLASQTLASHPYDPYRTFRMLAFGIFMDGPVGHVWYTTLDKMVYPEDPKCNQAVLLKTLLDQLVWAPAFTCVFYAFQNIFQGQAEHTMVDIQMKLLPTLLANYLLWPAAHVINFRFVPSQQRILYINCVQVIWSAFLSHMASTGTTVNLLSLLSVLSSFSPHLPSGAAVNIMQMLPHLPSQ